MEKNTRIFIRCDENLKDIIKKLADIYHISNNSELIRMLILKEAEEKGIK